MDESIPGPVRRPSATFHPSNNTARCHEASGFLGGRVKATRPYIFILSKQFAARQIVSIGSRPVTRDS